MAVIAITGDIGAGKSTFAKLLAEKLKCELLDADKTAKNLWTRNDIKKIAVSRWGNEISDKAGNLIPAKISEHVFSDKNENKFCNSLLHPLVMSELEKKAATLKNCVIEIPLLFEAAAETLRPKWIDKVIYVTAPFEVRARRCFEQRGWSIDELKRREKFLLPKKTKTALSDLVIKNNGSLNQLVIILNKNYASYNCY